MARGAETLQVVFGTKQSFYESIPIDKPSLRTNDRGYVVDVYILRWELPLAICAPVVHSDTASLLVYLLPNRRLFQSLELRWESTKPGTES
jgi:hypothetical protein